MRHFGFHALRIPIAVIMATIGGIAVTDASAQWVQQHFNLQPGWNSIFLEIDPSPRESNAQFAGLPIETVWSPKDEAVIEIPPLDGYEPLVEGPWDIWIPPAHPAAFASTLGIIRGGRVYLIKATATATWTVTGAPHGQSTDWRKGFTLNGFHVGDPSAVRFEDYFVGSPAHTNTQIYEVDSDGALAPLSDILGSCAGGDNPGDPCLDDSVCGEGGTCQGATVQTIQPGAAYWVRANAAAVYDGPIEIDSVSRRGLDYSVNILEHSMALRNLGGTSREVSFLLSSSVAVPPNQPSSAGDVPLRWLDHGSGDQASDLYQWRSIPYGSGGPSWTLAPSGQSTSRRTVRLEADRNGLAGAVVEDACVSGPLVGMPCGISGDCGEGGVCGEGGAEYQAVLTVRDGSGFRRWIPVAAQVFSGSSGTRAVGDARTGLWVGTATVNEVSWVTSSLSGDGDATCTAGELAGAPCVDDVDCGTGGVCTALGATGLRPAPESVDLRVILHLSEDGTYHLLSEVTQLYEPPPADSEDPGRLVLITPDCDPAFCNGLLATSTVNGKPFSRRLSSAAFQFDGPQTALTGDFDSTLAFQLALASDGRLNPFRHRQHPDHAQGYAVTRDVRLVFSAAPPPGTTAAGWGYSVMGGTYEETIIGLHRDPIYTRGFFELRRVSQAGALNQ